MNSSLLQSPEAIAARVCRRSLGYGDILRARQILWIYRPEVLRNIDINLLSTLGSYRVVRPRFKPDPMMGEHNRLAQMADSYSVGEQLLGKIMYRATRRSKSTSLVVEGILTSPHRVRLVRALQQEICAYEKKQEKPVGINFGVIILQTPQAATTESWVGQLAKPNYETLLMKEIERLTEIGSVHLNRVMTIKYSFLGTRRLF